MGTEHSPEEVAFLTADNLSRPAGSPMALFLRTGGVSEGIYASLNCGRGSGDEKDRVEENRARVAARLGVGRAMRLTGPRQVHMRQGADRESTVEARRSPGGRCRGHERPRPRRVHSHGGLRADPPGRSGGRGRRGRARGLEGGQRRALPKASSRPWKASAPGRNAYGRHRTAISQAAYEVSPDFKAAFLADGQTNERYFMQAESGRPHFNLPGYVRDRLGSKGVSSVHDIGACTYGNKSILFSYRRSVHRFEADYGRQISAIVLQ